LLFELPLNLYPSLERELLELLPLRLYGLLHLRFDLLLAGLVHLDYILHRLGALLSLDLKVPPLSLLLLGQLFNLFLEFLLLLELL
jgi:hypothetical protein